MAAASLVVRGAPGTIDTTFGTAGLAFQPSNASVVALAAQPDGKIILGGEVYGTQVSTETVSRVSDTLVADTSFGTNGVLAIDFGTMGYEYIENLFVQSNGDILAVSGGYNQAATLENALAARITSAGALDPTFGTAGKSTVSMPGPMPTSVGSVLAAGVVQSDGKIVMVGGIPTAGKGPQVFARFTTDGALDTSFGSAGFFEPTGSVGAANCGALQSDGNIVAAGYAASGTSIVWQVERITPAGAYDTSYGTMGVTTTALASDAYIFRCALDANGNLVVLGTDTVGGVPTFSLGRYTPAGVFDPTFNHGLPIEVGLGPAKNSLFPTTLLIDSMGRIMAVGGSVTNPITIVRLTPDGLLDLTFGTQGVLATSDGVSFVSTMYYYDPSAILESDQRLWLVGTGQVGGKSGTFAARVWL
jgi:uncharacterized delta-60 repeat protein